MKLSFIVAQLIDNIGLLGFNTISSSALGNLNYNYSSLILKIMSIIGTIPSYNIVLNFKYFEFRKMRHVIKCHIIQ